MSFTYITSSEDRETWLAREGVTASEVAMLASGGIQRVGEPPCREGGSSPDGLAIEYTVWGNAREPDIAAIVTAFIHTSCTTPISSSNDDTRGSCARRT